MCQLWDSALAARYAGLIAAGKPKSLSTPVGEVPLKLDFSGIVRLRERC